MAVADFLKSLGGGLATAGKVAGNVLEPIGERVAQVESGEAPRLDEEARQRQQKMDDAAITSKAQALDAQLEMGRKYGTLTPDQEQQYVDAISDLYSHPSQMPTLIEKLHRAVHPNGATYQTAPAPTLTNATPQGGTAQADLKNAIDLAEMRSPKKEYVSPDGKSKDWFLPGHQPAGWSATNTGMGSYARQGSHLVDPANAITLMNTVGVQFPKQDGSTWTAEEIGQFPQGIVLQPWTRGDQTYFVPVDQRVKLGTFGNIVNQIPEFGQVTPEGINPLGLARVPTVGTREVPGMTPGEKIPLKSTSTPQTTGALPANPSPQSGAAPATIPNGAATAPPRTKVGSIIKPTTPATKDTTKTTALGSSPPAFAPGTMLSQGRSAMPVVSSMSVVGANVFGVNGEPPIWDYSNMYDDPKLGSALNKALTMNSLTLPGVHGEPGFWDSLATAAGVTGWSQEKINKAAVDARKDVQALGGDKAMKFLSRLMAFQEDLSALRTATRASGAQGSIQTLVRAAPIYNVSSGQDFRNQLHATLQTAASSMRGYPVINPEYAQWWQKGAQQALSGEGATQSIKQQYSPSTKQYRYSTDGGKTWQPGKAPTQ